MVRQVIDSVTNRNEMLMDSNPAKVYLLSITGAHAEHMADHIADRCDWLQIKLEAKKGAPFFSLEWNEKLNL